MTAVRSALRHPEAVIAAVLLAAMVVIGLVNPAFWGLDNLFGLLRSNVVTGIMALGVLMVMITGGIDVSFPAFAVAAMYLVVGWMADTGYQGLVLPFIAATLIGLALGACNALFIRAFRMIPLIVTLGTASVVRGLLLGVVGTSVININRMPPSLIDFGKSDILTVTNPDGTRYGLTAMILIYAALALGVHLILRHTVIGRGLYAYGGSPEAASRVGFDTRKILALAYCGAGALAGFAGLLHFLDDLARQPARLRRARTRRHCGCCLGRRQHLRRPRQRRRHAVGRVPAGDDQEQPDPDAHRHDLAAGGGRPHHRRLDGAHRAARPQAPGVMAMDASKSRCTGLHDDASTRRGRDAEWPGPSSLRAKAKQPRAEAHPWFASSLRSSQ